MKRVLGLIVLMVAGQVSRGVGTAASPQEPAVPEQLASPSPDDSWSILDGCIDDPRLDDASVRDFEGAWTRIHECGEAARNIVRTGAESDREKLWSVFDGLPEDSRLAQDVLDAFLDWHVEKTLDALESAPAPTVREPRGAKAEVPEFLRGAPGELQDAWHTFHAVVQINEKPRKHGPADDAIAFQSHQPAFRRAVAGFLRGSESAASSVSELSRYVWAGWCGTGSNLLYSPQSKALVIAQLQHRRPDLALAASQGLDSPVLAGDEKAARWDRRLLAAAGIDWEPFYLGGVLSGETDLAPTLARRGSERAARQLLAATRLLSGVPQEESPVDSDGLVWSLAALVEPSGSCMGYGTSNSQEVQRDREAGPVDGSVQEDVLDFLAENVGPEAGLDEAEAASHLLVRLCRPESQTAFHVMFWSAYSEVRTRGAIGLRALGETVGNPRPSRPVAFRVLVDGRPASNRKINWTLQTGKWERVSRSGETNGEGLVRLDRDPFLDPRHPVLSVRLAAPDLVFPDDVWFEAAVKPPADLDAVTAVSVRTGSLAITVPRSLLAATEGAPPTLQLLAETDRYTDQAAMIPVSEELPVTSARITFPYLQHGRYQIWLQRGTSMHTSVPVEVRSQTATVEVSERSIEEELAADDWQ